MSIFSKVKKEYPDAFLSNGMSHLEVKKRIKSVKGTPKAFYTYIMVGDGTIYALGKGTDDRAKVFSAMETDLGANGHIKGGIGALMNILFKDIERIFVPTSTPQEALDIEDDLKSKFNFHEKSVKEVSSELFKQRLKDLQASLPSSIWNEYFGNNKILKVLLIILGDPSGNDYATIRKGVYDIEEDNPGIVKAFNLFFKGGFKPLKEPEVDNQLSLFERIKKRLDL
jgi:hypothetical protein